MFEADYVRDEVQCFDYNFEFTEHVIFQNVNSIQKFLREGHIPDVEDILWVFKTQNLKLFKEMVTNVPHNNLHCVARSIFNTGMHGKLYKEYLEAILNKIKIFKSDVLSFISFSNPNCFPDEMVIFARDNGADISHLFSRCCTLKDMRRLRDAGASVFSKVHSIRIQDGIMYGTYTPYGSSNKNAISLETFVSKMDSYMITDALPMFGRPEDYAIIVKEEHGIIKIQRLFRKYLAQKHSTEELNLERCSPVNLFNEEFGAIRRRILNVQTSWEQ